MALCFEQWLSTRFFPSRTLGGIFPIFWPALEPHTEVTNSVASLRKSDFKKASFTNTN